MTKSELITRIAERLPYLNRKDAEIIIDTIFDTMVEALVKEDRIEIRGFGSFKVKQRGNRDGRNPKTGESVQIPPKRMPFFKIGKELYQRINTTHEATAGE